MFSKFLKIIALLIFISNNSYATVIDDINVTGNKRLSKESIIVFGQIYLDVDYTENGLNKILKNLYGTDFFNEIKINLTGSTLNISVIENPIIESLEINGIQSKNLQKALMDALKLKSRKSYVESIFLADLNLVKNIIKSNGYYFSEIKTSTVKNEIQNTVKIIYDVDLGKKAKINSIKFIGDKKIKDRKLRNIITSEESRFWKFISNKIYLDKQRINLDKRLLKNYYKNNGFYNVKVENSFIEFKDNGSFGLTFNIDSGEKFIFNKIDIELSKDYDPRYFESILKVMKKLENEIYSLYKVEKILKEIDKIALSKQYEFINADLSEEIIDENKLNLTIKLVETKKLYVEKINILGNQFTLEEVIRNTLIVDEGDPYNEILFNKSINNLKAKNIFGFVKTKIYEGSSEHLKTVDIIVSEKPTGELSLAAGFGTSGGTIGGGIKENNFLGKGISLDSNLIYSAKTIKGKLIYSKPNFNYSDNTLFTSISSTSSDYMKDYGYKTSNVGFSVGTAFEQYENFYFRPEIAAGLEDLETTSAASTTLKGQQGSYFDTYFNYSLDRDLRNQRYRATEGSRILFYQELPVISKNSEIMNSIEFIKYRPLLAEMVGKFSIYGKAINSLNGKDVRVSKRINIPSNKLRGFESGKVGPVDGNDYIGGNYVSSLNISTTLPGLLPSFQNTDFSLFADAANVWGVDYDSSINNGSRIRSSVGIGLDLLTPIGPLNFSLSQPISKTSSDKTETFRFNLGTTF